MKHQFSTPNDTIGTLEKMPMSDMSVAKFRLINHNRREIQRWIRPPMTSAIHADYQRFVGQPALGGNHVHEVRIIYLVDYPHEMVGLVPLFWRVAGAQHNQYRVLYPRCIPLIPCPWFMGWIPIYFVVG
jgi:hypothetical protein